MLRYRYINGKCTLCYVLPQVDKTNIIPSTTRVDSFIAINKETATCDLVLKTNNDAIIRGVVVFGEQIFAEESLFVYPKVCSMQTSGVLLNFQTSIFLHRLSVSACTSRMFCAAIPKHTMP